MTRRLYRSRDDRMLAGVCGGLAERLDIDPALVRIVWAILVLPTGFLALLVYIIAALVIPDQDEHDRSTAGLPPWTAAPGSWPPPGSPPVPGPWPPPGSPPAPGTWPVGPTPDQSGPPLTTAPMAPDASMSRRDRRRAARAARRRDRAPGSASLVVGGGLVVLGTWFLLREYVPALDASRFWPVAVVGLGVLLVIVALGRRSDGPDVPHR